MAPPHPDANPCCGESLSKVVADLAARGLDRIDTPVVIRTDERSGFPVLSVGVRVTSADVDRLLDDE